MAPRRKPSGSGPDPDAWYALKNFVEGLYDEMDKLYKKAPTTPLSDLATKRVNRGISEAKSLLGPFDVYVSEIEVFVPAGENPEVRDAVLVLREIMQGLQRVNELFKLALQRMGW
ncbi:MAG: hypothetical protein M3451_07545 [Chloroflexota bacterium]|nr:hypothetical protein [Chloroflexota bacterium]